MKLREKNRWHLTEERKVEVTKMVLDTINKISEFKVTEESETRWNVGTDFSELIGIGPYHIKDILEGLGYIEDSYSDNGWEMDYWFHFQHPEPNFPPLCLSGTAIIHEMLLHGEEEDYETYEERENKLRNDPELKELFANSIRLLDEAEKVLKEEQNNE